jgi:hypothetical protein
MLQVTHRGCKISQHSLLLRAALASATLALLLLSSACANLAKVGDPSIPKLVTPLADADFNNLTGRLQSLLNLQALRSSRVFIEFKDAASAERFRQADALLVLQRPDKIRLIVQIPVTGSRIAEMVSEANHFKVAIYRPEKYRRFLIGTSDADYSQWRAQLGREEQQSAIINARPFHFTEALMPRPLHLGEPGFVYGLEESLIEEPDLRQGAKRGARLLRSFYVISELELPAAGQGPSRVRRRFWFDRTDRARFARQQIFDDRGTLVTEVRYSTYMVLRAGSEEQWPSVILVSRPHDLYSARLTFSQEGFELNPPDLPATAFVLENTEGLPETNLDKP